MPLILLAVALVLAPIVLMPLSLVLRYRAGTARRQARGWVTALNLVALAISTSLFMMGAALASIWVPHALRYSLLGLLGGFALGIIGLWLSRWERAPQSLHYTPNRWLVLGVTLVVTARVLFGFWRGWHAWRHAPGDTPWLAAFGVAGSLAAGAVVLGYYVSYWMGVRRRWRRHMGAQSTRRSVPGRIGRGGRGEQIPDRGPCPAASPVGRIGRSTTRRSEVKRLETFVVACTVVLGLAGLALAQDKPAAPAGAPQGMPPLPKPGPEHAMFKDVAGTWDAKVESFMVPGAPPAVSNGTETSRVGCGGLCLISDFKGSFVMGPPSTPATPFEGHGTETYDVGKKKYVGSWVDSMSTGLSTTESTHDAATRTMNGWITGPDLTGKVSKMRSTVTMKDPNTRVFSMYNVGPDGKESLGMRITYTRRKEAGPTGANRKGE